MGGKRIEKIFIREGHDVKVDSKHKPTGEPKFWLKLRNRLAGRLLKPNIVGEISANDLYRKAKELGVQNVLLADEKYKLTDVESIRKFLAQDDTDKENYVPIWHDCDNYSFRLMGQFHVKPWSYLAIGITWSRTHAFNIFYDGKKWWLVEPQTDAIIDAEKAGGDYKPLEIVIL